MNNIQIQDFQYPEDDDSYQESDDSELNPFLFELEQQNTEAQRIDDMYRQLLKKDLEDPEHEMIQDVTYNLKKLRKYALVIQKEHQMFQVLKKAYEDLKNKTVNHDQFIISLERGYEKQISELQSELETIQNKEEKQSKEFERQVAALQEQLESKKQLLQIKDEEILFIKNNQQTLQHQVMTLSQECLKIQKELNTVKKIKTSNFLQLTDKSDFPYSTFELVVTTKLKSKIIEFLQPKDIVNLLLTKKSLYFALCQFKLIVPQTIKCETYHLNAQIKNLLKQVETFKRLQSDCSEAQIKTQIIKTFDLQYSPNEFIDPVIIEANNFVKGTQFIGRLEHIEDPDSSEGLKTFVQGMAMRSQQTAQLLKQDPFNLSQFTQSLIINANDREQLIKERTEQTKKLRKNQQDIYEKLFNLGTVVAADVGLYGLYSTTMQRLFASLYVYGSHLQQECRLQQSVIYYMVVQHWQLIEKVRIMEQMNIDKQDRIKNNGNEIKALYEQIKGLQAMMKQQQLTIMNHSKELEKEEQQKSHLETELKETKSLLLNYGKNIKLLAIEIRELRIKNKKIIKEQNIAAKQVDDLKQQIQTIQV